MPLWLAWSTELSTSSPPPFLARHERKAKHLTPEAQWGDELYRCLVKTTGGKCALRSEFLFSAQGKINIFIPSKKWGIEILYGSDRLAEHEARFARGGKYSNWDLLTDYIILDFRLNSRPSSAVISKWYTSGDSARD